MSDAQGAQPHSPTATLAGETSGCTEEVHHELQSEPANQSRPICTDDDLQRLKSLREQRRSTRLCGEDLMQRMEELDATGADAAILEEAMNEYLELERCYAKLGVELDELTKLLEERFDFAHLQLTLHQDEIGADEAMQRLREELAQAEEQLDILESNRERLLASDENDLTMAQGLCAFGTSEGLDEEMLWSAIREDSLSEASEPLVKQIMQLGHEHRALRQQIELWKDRIQEFQKLCYKKHPRANGKSKANSKRSPCHWPSPSGPRPTRLKFVGLRVDEFPLEHGEQSVHEEFRQWMTQIQTGEWGDHKTSTANSTATQLNATGVCVERIACDTQHCDDCLAAFVEATDSYLALPGSMNESSKRHFIKVPTIPGFTLERRPEHRRDFVLPMPEPLEVVLRTVLSGNVGSILVDALGVDAQICEITAIVSEPGATAQAFHGDNCWRASDPRLVTIFLALHDILDEAQGPTYFCPHTHVPECFPGNEWLAPTPALVAERDGGVWFELHTGDAMLMESTTWHCGGSNTSERRRTLLSVSFTEYKMQQGTNGAANEYLPLQDFLTS